MVSLLHHFNIMDSLPDLISNIFLLFSQVEKAILFLPGTLYYVLPMLIIGYSFPVILGMIPYLDFESNSYCIQTRS